MVKLYAYNLNAQYPTAGKDAKDDTHGKSKANPEQKYIDTILLVLEHVPGGELFDILYYTSALKEVVARTYFKQIINGLEACHNANVVHCDLKPENLLLDSKYNLKITYSGLVKIAPMDRIYGGTKVWDPNISPFINSVTEALFDLVTSHRWIPRATESFVSGFGETVAGIIYDFASDPDATKKAVFANRGYQAPELLLNQKYDFKCDVFSAGVILFILMAGC